MPLDPPASSTALATGTSRRRRQGPAAPPLVNAEAGVNPVIQTYLLSGEHGTSRRYLLELCLVLGLFLPWLGPLLGICGIIPLIELDVLERAVITPSSYCFAQAANGTVCNGTAVYEYYFWNLTNSQQWLSGEQAPQLVELGPYAFQISEFRQMTTFTGDYYTVNYTTYKFQAFMASQSCAGCQLSDVLVTVNSGYLAAMQAFDSDAALLMELVPMSLTTVLSNITTALIQSGVKPQYASALAVAQWGTCSLLGTPVGPEFCNWAAAVAKVPVPAQQLNSTAASNLTSAFLGNSALYSALKPDPAARFPDPLLAAGFAPLPAIGANVSLAFAWGSQNAPLAQLIVPSIRGLSSELSPAIAEVSMQTGKGRNDTAYQVNSFNGATDMRTFPNVPLPFGDPQINGSAFEGLFFPLSQLSSGQLSLYDPVLGRALDVQYSGNSMSLVNVPASRYALNPDLYKSCSDEYVLDRCAYPDGFTGAFNASLTYGAPTLYTLPNFYQADPVLPESVGSPFTVNASLHGWTLDVEAGSGLTLNSAKTYQLSHYVTYSDILYPDLWINESSPLGGMWLPTVWVRQTYIIQDSDPSSLPRAYQMKQAFFILLVIVVPVLGGLLLLTAAYGLCFAPGCKGKRAALRLQRRSRAAPAKLTKLQLAMLRDVLENKEKPGSSAMNETERTDSGQLLLQTPTVEEFQDSNAGDAYNEVLYHINATPHHYSGDATSLLLVTKR
ncbi:hypothetical protein WJX73_000949 [Symbiochloris irregularis]|uniref:Uncharacterized protein n=1 Tax=Symbiochloris irregularis TaxID=706552 RepID=A0AAW1PZQ9_9CHLO